MSGINRSNTSIQKRHLNKHKEDRLFSVTNTEKFQKVRAWEKAKKAFNHMPTY